jgi:hypothetical protein
VPTPFPLDKVPSEVSEQLAKALGVDQARLVSAAEARLPSGEVVRVVNAVSANKPNVVVRTTFNDAGEMRSVAEVERLAGRKIFVPDFTPGFDRPPTPKAPVTIEPMLNDWRLYQCQRIRETITVTIPPTGAVARADVYLLADTTGSMGSIIDAVKAGASAILNHPGLTGFDVAWGVGNYHDFPITAGVNSYAFQPQLAPTTSLAAVDAAIATWTALEGSDTPEGQLYALHQIATDPAIGWRADSKRILVWFGDAPGHDPICPDLTGLADAITEATATADLVAAPGVTVVAVSTDTGVADALDGDPTVASTDYGLCPVGGTAGQATRIAAATGGSHTAGIDANAIVTTLGNLIASAVASTALVQLVPTGDSAQFVELITPPSFGPLPGDVEHVLSFEVTWVGVKACAERDQVFTGTIDVLADGIVVAAKRVGVTVPACRYHYTIEMVCGIEPEDREDCHPVVPGRYATAVTIFNPTTCPALIEKRFAPLVVNAKVIGREPKFQDAKWFASIKLEAGQATMDDCCNLREVVRAVNGLVFGVLDIVSDKPLAVSAVHTADGKESGPALTTRTIEPLKAP